MRSAVIILMLLPLIAWSQDINNNSSIHIPASITMYAGSVNNGGLISNSGSMIVSGNWLNTNSYEGTGTIILSGTDQFVGNNAQAIENLVIDGGGSKTITSGVIINKTIDFSNGIVDVGSGGSLMIGRDATIDGGSPGSFVNGPLTSAGTGYRFYPVGVNKHYYPVWFTDVRGLDPVVEVRASETVPIVETEVPVNITNHVYWTRKDIAGKFDGSLVTASIQSVPDDRNRVVFVQGSTTDDEFTIVNVDEIFPEGGLTVASSREEITKNLFTIGDLPEEPVGPSYLSTTLSPNASNAVNRTIRLQGLDLASTDFLFEVYNRWGNQLFESKSLDFMSSTGWDGKQNGQLLPSGAYPYRVVYRDRRGKEIQQTGFVTIVY